MRPMLGSVDVREPAGFVDSVMGVGGGVLYSISGVVLTFFVRALPSRLFGTSFVLGSGPSFHYAAIPALGGGVVPIFSAIAKI